MESLSIVQSLIKQIKYNQNFLNLSNIKLIKKYSDTNHLNLNETLSLITSENNDSIYLLHRLRFILEKQINKEFLFYFNFFANIKKINLFYYTFLCSYEKTNDVRFISILIKFNKIFHFNFIFLSFLNFLIFNKSETNLFLHHYKKTNAHYNSIT
jgi:hypothetical protein